MAPLRAPALALWPAAATLIARKMPEAPANDAQSVAFGPIHPKKGEKRIIRIW
ncbi:protein of unknown function [Cupriavidus neocaledonicus]|uniref:Uncharacterized protein n=1 Tax=Cupriavidus neocaledonicus TaxID=1040979 RepID=A0A375GYH7_9BURK|nr:hypothetical protein CBM2605_A10131 [Cupriavidus neocaledonicus]SPD45174.1 protein of unknown function [Cupriavidus neocaledonicus]